MNGVFMKAASLAVALLAAYLPDVSAVEFVDNANGCGALNRNIDFSDSQPGPYTDADLQSDFDGYQYFKRRDMASIVDVGGSKYLDVKLHQGCVGTVGEKGCGLLGALPLFGVSDAATLEYTVQFGDGYDFRLGGKLMGLCSGACKSGCHSSASQGFSARIMWGPEGSLYLYTYTYSGSTRTCGMNTKPKDPVRLQPGQDYRIRLSVKMNNPDASDGVASLYVDGKHIATAEGLKMRDSPEQVVDSMVFHTFFGGSGPAWAAAKDEHILFKSIKIWDGTCGGNDGALKLAESAKWEPGSTGGQQGARKLALNTSIYGSWNGRFCLWYEVTNDGAEDCNRFILETNVDPSVGTMMSFKNLKVVDSDDTNGFYMFTREQDKHAMLKPGGSRSGNVCLESPRNIMQSNARIDASYVFNAYCEG